MSFAGRSVSRGRELFSTGRGGVGNIRQPSQSADKRPTSDGPDDFSVTRGREPIVNPMQVFSTGRGGAGNIRSPSRDIQRAPVVHGVEEEDVIKEYKKSQEGAPVSSGRGGLGNFNRSRSRDPASTLIVHSAGEGGVGNTVARDGSLAESELKNCHATDEECHSTGRGGDTNKIPTHEPTIEHHPHIKDGYKSTDHDGAGNFVKETS